MRSGLAAPTPLPYPSAVYHCSVIGVSRSRGRSAAGVAAYISASVAHDPRDPDRVLDYRRKTEPVAVGYVHTAHRSAADFALALDSAEKRKNSQCAREVVVGLPASAPAEVRQQVAEQIADDMAARWDVPVMWAVHRPDREGDQRNHHVHFVMGTRDSAGRKVRRLDVADSARVEVEWLRAQVATRCQAVVPAEERSAWDHRSFVRRGLLDAIATRHEGPLVTGVRRTEARAARRERRAPHPCRCRNAIFNDELRRLAAEREQIDAQLYANIRDEGDRSVDRSERALEREREAAGGAARRLREAAGRGPEASRTGEAGEGLSAGGGESSEGIAGRIRGAFENLDRETRRAARRRRDALDRSGECVGNERRGRSADDQRQTGAQGIQGKTVGDGQADRGRPDYTRELIRIWDEDREREKAKQQPATASQSPTPAPAQPTPAPMPQQAEEEDEEAAEARRQAKARETMAQRAKDSPLAKLPTKRPSPLEDHFPPGGRYGDEPEQGHSQGIPGRRR